ncbi:hypothetical protein AUP68_16489 [Ilyonectria robusta]
MHNLGNALSDMFLRTKDLKYLNEAIELSRKVVDLTPEEYSGRAIILNSLGHGLGERYLMTGDLSDLEEAIRVGQNAVELTPEGHSEQGMRLNNLANRLSDRYSRTRTAEDIENAIKAGRKAVSVIPEDHPERAMFLTNLGDKLGKRYSQTGALEDVHEAISLLQSALRRPMSTMLHRIEAVRHVLDYCATISDWKQAYQASDFALNLVPELVARSLENTDKQHMLSRIVGLASDAAASAFHAGKPSAVALSFLEQGRGVLATSIEEMRTDVSDLRQNHPDLAHKFNGLRGELEQLLPQNGSLDGVDSPSGQARTDRRCEVHDQINDVLAEIRTKAGFEDFLLAPKESELKAAAVLGPIVVINVSVFRCDAILVEQHQIRSIPLPKLEMESLTKWTLERDLKSLEVLEWLWEVVTRPVLDVLGFTDAPSDDKWPHVWWIPTGPLSKFPLHAAGHHKKGSSEAVLDRVMSSYSTSIKAIIHSRERTSPSTTQLVPAQALLVSMGHTPNSTRLPFATREVAMLQRLFETLSFASIQPGRRKQDIISHLPECKMFHFAGHAGHDKTDKSYLLLEDGKLTVDTLLEINVRERSPFLAYLSACGTGQINDEKFVDESIHLISGYQLAGFRHVIGTLWEVKDELCVDMTRITYEGIRDGGMTDESVCRGLHNASRCVRNRSLDAPSKAGTAMVREDKVLAQRDQRETRLPRDVELCDADDEDREPLDWVPYVHFGV